MSSTDYFGVFGLAPGFALNETALKESYFALQREAHPDRVAGADTKEKIAAITRATDINKGYQVLKDPVARAEYLLMQKGIKADKPCVEVLMEAMEQREALAELNSEKALAAFSKKIKTEIEDSKAILAKAFSAGAFEQAKKETLRLKYLTKLAEEIRLKSLETA